LVSQQEVVLTKPLVPPLVDVMAHATEATGDSVTVTATCASVADICTAAVPGIASVLVVAAGTVMMGTDMLQQEADVLEELMSSGAGVYGNLTFVDDLPTSVTLGGLNSDTVYHIYVRPHVLTDGTQHEPPVAIRAVTTSAPQLTFAGEIDPDTSDVAGTSVGRPDFFTDLALSAAMQLNLTSDSAGVADVYLMHAEMRLGEKNGTCEELPCSLPWVDKNSVMAVHQISFPAGESHHLMTGISAGYPIFLYVHAHGAVTGKEGAVYFLGKFMTPGWNVIGVAIFSIGMTLLCVCVFVMCMGAGAKKKMDGSAKVSPQASAE